MMHRVVFVQSQVSQLDEPVYARMHEISPDATSVIYWNDYGFSRKRIDPETGVVPDFVEPGMSNYPRQWIDSRSADYKAILAAILALKPTIVVLSDQPQVVRLWLAVWLRHHGVRVALRVDKNHLSERPRAGLALLAERQLVQRTFDVLAPTSSLTSTYYGWPSHRQLILAPYPTNERKFAPHPAVRLARRGNIRDELGIPPGAFVFLSATKFSARESPWELIESFAATTAALPDVHLIALGEGPLLPEIKRAATERGLSRISFPGFVPFRVLQDYFFAADAYLHFVAVGPWEVSPQDALAAGLGLITTKNVGSAQVFLKGELARFLVPFGDRAAAAARIIELATERCCTERFAPARGRTSEYTVAACAQRWVDAVHAH